MDYKVPTTGGTYIVPLPDKILLDDGSGNTTEISVLDLSPSHLVSVATRMGAAFVDEVIKSK